MKLLLLKGFYKGTKSLLAQFLELALRVGFFALPLGFYVLLLQFKDKPMSTTTIGNYLGQNGQKSTMQMVAPNTLLVCVDGFAFKKDLNKFVLELNKKMPHILTFLRIVTYVLVIAFCIKFLYR